MARKNGGSNFLVLILLVLVVITLFVDKPWAARVNSEDDVKNVVAKYIQENPEKIMQSLQGMQAKAQAASAENAKKTIPQFKAQIESDPNSGVVNPDGDVTVVEFFDYSCGYCKKVFPDVKKLVEEDKKVRLVLKEFPILGPGSEIAAKAAIAVLKLDKSKYFAYHSALMEFQGPKNEEVVLDIAKKLGLKPEKIKEEMNKQSTADIIAANRQLGSSIGVHGTPAFLIGGDFVPGALPYEELKKRVEDARGKTPEAGEAAKPEAKPQAKEEEKNEESPEKAAIAE